MNSPELPIKTQNLVTFAGLCGQDVGTERWLAEAKLSEEGRSGWSSINVENCNTLS